ncbi:MAG: FIST N-terminal domain-containing protein [Pirellulales bacterium]
MTDVAGTRFASALTLQADPGPVVAELSQQLELQGWAGQAPPDLLVCFATHHHRRHWGAVNQQLHQLLRPRQQIGCLGQGVIGTDAAGRGQEIEDDPAWSLWAAWSPSAELEAAHLSLEQTPEGMAFTGFDRELPENSSLILLADPFSFPADVLLERWREDRPGTLVMGGMASGGSAPGENRLVLNDRTFDHGAIALAVSGPLNITPVVSQGCRPIGDPMIVTRAERNVVLELGGQPAVTQLQRIFQSLPNHEKEMLQRGLHLGRVVSEYQEQFEAGDFLIRNVFSLDGQRAALIVGDYFRPGQTVQFHLRDAGSAHRDLQLLLEKARHQTPPPAAALLFTCNGRGTHLFGEPHHDVTVTQRTLGPIPVAGFFAQGEIGPVSAENFLHGFTASIALFSTHQK